MIYRGQQRSRRQKGTHEATGIHWAFGKGGCGMAFAAGAQQVRMRRVGVLMNTAAAFLSCVVSARSNRHQVLCQISVVSQFERFSVLTRFAPKRAPSYDGA
jgi:hypothetical protein